LGWDEGVNKAFADFFIHVSRVLCG
jgi:hypothetical protein